MYASRSFLEPWLNVRSFDVASNRPSIESTRTPHLVVYANGAPPSPWEPAATSAPSFRRRPLANASLGSRAPNRALPRMP